jgi:hypothetical protein
VADDSNQQTSSVLDDGPSLRAWVIAVAVVLIEASALAWGLTLLP